MALCIILCIVFAAGCSKAANSSAALPEVRNNGTAIQWKYSDETDWRDLVALTELTGAAGENGKNGMIIGCLMELISVSRTLHWGIRCRRNLWISVSSEDFGYMQQ